MICQSKTAVLESKKNNYSEVGRKIIFYAVIVVVSCFILFPIFWMIMTSIKPPTKIFTYPPIFFSFTPQLSNFSKAWTEMGLSRLFFNTMKVSLSTAFLTIAISSPAAYSLARLRYPGRETLAHIILLSYMFPGVLVLIPIFLIIARLHLVDTHLALVIGCTTFSIPFCTWLLRAYFVTLPPDLEDAARVDGCSHFGALVRVVLPLSAPGIAAAAAFAFMSAWGDYLFALTFISSEMKKTLPPALSTFITRESINWGLLSAGGVITTIPVIVFFLLLQKYLVGGLTMGGVKE